MRPLWGIRIYQNRMRNLSSYFFPKIYCHASVPNRILYGLATSLIVPPLLFLSCNFLLWSCFDKAVQRRIKLLTPNWHLHRVERILHHEICVQLIHSFEYNLHVGLRGLRHQQELETCERLEAIEPEMARFKHFYTRRPHGEVLRIRILGMDDSRRELPCYCVDAMECAGEDEQVV
jgi:hypothetical protein